MDLASLSRKGALPALATLAAAHPTPLSAGEFVKGTGMDAGAAIRLREELHLLGVLDARVVRERGSVKEFEVTLTEFGRELATHALAMRKAIEKHAPPGRATTRGARR